MLSQQLTKPRPGSGSSNQQPKRQSNASTILDQLKQSAQHYDAEKQAKERTKEKMVKEYDMVMQKHRKATNLLMKYEVDCGIISALNIDAMALVRRIGVCNSTLSTQYTISSDRCVSLEQSLKTFSDILDRSEMVNQNIISSEMMEKLSKNEETLRKLVEEMEILLTEETLNHESLQQTVFEFTDKNKNLLDSLKDVKKKMEEKNSTIVAEELEIARLTERLNETKLTFEEANVALGVSFREMARRQVELERNIPMLEEELSELQKMRTRKESELRDLSVSRPDPEGAIVQYTSELVELDATLSSLAVSLQEAQDENSKSLSSITEAEQEAVEAGEDLRATREQYEASKSLETRAKHAVTETTVHASARARRLLDLVSILPSLRQKLMELQLMEALLSELADIEAEMSSAGVSSTRGKSRSDISSLGSEGQHLHAMTCAVAARLRAAFQGLFVSLSSPISDWKLDEVVCRVQFPLLSSKDGLEWNEKLANLALERKDVDVGREEAASVVRGVLDVLEGLCEAIVAVKAAPLPKSLTTKVSIGNNPKKKDEWSADAYANLVRGSLGRLGRAVGSLQQLERTLLARRLFVPLPLAPIGHSEQGDAEGLQILQKALEEGTRGAERRRAEFQQQLNAVISEQGAVQRQLEALERRKATCTGIRDQMGRNLDLLQSTTTSPAPKGISHLSSKDTSTRKNLDANITKAVDSAEKVNKSHTDKPVHTPMVSNDKKHNAAISASKSNPVILPSSTTSSGFSGKKRVEFQFAEAPAGSNLPPNSAGKSILKTSTPRLESHTSTADRRATPFSHVSSTPSGESTYRGSLGALDAGSGVGVSGVKRAPMSSLRSSLALSDSESDNSSASSDSSGREIREGTYLKKPEITSISSRLEADKHVASATNQKNGDRVQRLLNNANLDEDSDASVEIHPRHKVKRKEEGKRNLTVGLTNSVSPKQPVTAVATPKLQVGSKMLSSNKKGEVTNSVKLNPKNLLSQFDHSETLPSKNTELKSSSSQRNSNSSGGTARKGLFPANPNTSASASIFSISKKPRPLAVSAMKSSKPAKPSMNDLFDDCLFGS